MPFKAVVAAINVIAFLLLSICLLSPAWLDIITPGTSCRARGSGVRHLRNRPPADYKTAARILMILASNAASVAFFTTSISCLCTTKKGTSGMLVSSAASFLTGAFGFAAISIYPMGRRTGQLDIMWGFGLACLVFTLYVMNGFLSFILHLVNLARRVDWQSAENFLEEGLAEPTAGDSTAAVELSTLLYQEAAASPARNLLPSPAVCFNKSFES